MPFIILLALITAIFGVGTMFKFLGALVALLILGPVALIVVIIILIVLFS
jgi:hypothetical protein